MRIRYLILMVIALLLLGCSDNEPDKKAVTFMVYMAADNSLSGFALNDIDEMERAVFDPAMINVIVQADFSQYMEESGCYRWEIVPDGLYDNRISSPRIDELGEIDSGSWQSLSSFYNWCKSEYPAERYILTIWSHGNDWYSYPTNPNKFCPDIESGSFFDIPGKDLRNAFIDLNCHPDLVIIDACHMQSVEILSELAEHCRYVCASTDAVPEDGFPYDDIISAISNSNPEVYSLLPGIYVDSYKPGGSQNLLGTVNQPVSASLIDCSLFMDMIIPDIQDLTNYSAGNEIQAEIRNARESCLEFNDLEIDIDLLEFTALITDMTSDPSLAQISGKIDQNLIMASDAYNYPVEITGNILITVPDSTSQNISLNLQDSYRKLEFDKLTGWFSYILSWYEDVR